MAFPVRLASVAFVLASALAGCAARPSASDATTPWRDSAPHEVRFVQVAPDTRLEVLDWGGSGPPLVLLAGLGNTGHVYDELADALRDYHVLAITRRGFGASSQPPNGYDPDTLAADIVGVLDALGIAKASFAGHSIAGEELTKLGSRYPSRVERLVYLDAAYDRTAPDAEGAPPEPEPAESDLASVEAFRRWAKRMMGEPWPEAEVHAALVIDAQGRVVKHKTPDAITEAMWKGVAPPRYADLRVPALALYRVDDTPRDLLPFWSTLAESQQAKAQTFFARTVEQLAEARATFRRDAPGGRVVELHGADHYLFLRPKERTAAEIRAFLEAK